MGDTKARQDSHTRASFQRDATYGERVSRSCGGIAFGWLMILASLYLLYWNEGRAVAQYNTIQEGLGLCVSQGLLDDTSPATDFPLLHFNAKLRPEVVRDEQFNVQVAAVTLERVVEVYQWHEKQERREYKEHGGKRIETTYSYYTAWSASRIDHTRFDDPHGHENPSYVSYKGAVSQSAQVRAGPYVLDSALRSKISAWTILPVAKATLPAALHAQDDFAVTGDLNNPHVSDVRISFRYNGKKGTEVSVIGRAHGGAIGPFRSRTGNTIELLTLGVVSAEDMFSSEELANTLLTWGLRFAGWIMVIIGLSMTNDILYTIADFIPIVSNVIGASLTIVNVTLGTALTLIVVAVGWIRFRPLFAAGLACAACLSTYFLVFSSRKQQQQQEKRKD